jgi:hypothetical protein
MWVLKICDRWGKFPDEVEEREQSMAGHLAREQVVLEALKRYS